MKSYRYTLTVHDSKLTVGGWFSIAGEKVAGYVAQWTKHDFICGDGTGDGQVNVGDAVYILNYLFKSQSAPDPLCVGDANGDGIVNLGDAVHLLNYLFKTGPGPVDDCCP